MRLLRSPRLCLAPALLVALYVAAPCAAAAAQTAASATGSETVAGTVVSALDAHPVEHATVELLEPSTERVVQSTTADELGRFRFGKLAKAAFVLRGEAPGFLQSSYQQHAQFSTAVITGSTVPTDALVLRLRPLGTLTGTITDENAEPLPQAQVHLYRRETVSGQTRFDPAGQSHTNDLGQYHFARLAPGTYFIAVTAAPWYAVHPVPNQQQLAAMPGIVSYQDPALDVAYPITYYPTGSDPARASPIEIDGKQARADLQLTPVPAITVTLPRSESDPGRPIPQLQPAVFGQPSFAPYSSLQIGGSIVLTGLAPGDYILRANTLVRTPDGGERVENTTTTPVRLTPNGANTLPATVPPLAHVHLTLQSSDGGPLPPNLQARLLRASTTPESNPGPAPFFRQGELDVEPGDYFVGLNMPLRAFVRSVSVNGKPLPSNDLHLAANDSLTCIVTVAQGTHSVRGTVQRGSAKAGAAPVSGAMLLLIPADQHLPPRKWFLQQSDSDGSFEIPSIPPGPYLLLALDEPAWAADWRTVDFLSRTLPQSTPVLIPENGPAQITLPAAIPVVPL